MDPDSWQNGIAEVYTLRRHTLLSVMFIIVVPIPDVIPRHRAEHLAGQRHLMNKGQVNVGKGQASVYTRRRSQPVCTVQYTYISLDHWIGVGPDSASNIRYQLRPLMSRLPFLSVTFAKDHDRHTDGLRPVCGCDVLHL